MKIGDKVRFLNEVGGGVVVGFQGNDLVLVEDADGFEIPMLKKECVVIETDSYNRPQKVAPSTPAPTAQVREKPVTYREPEIKGNNVLNVYLAYVPQDPKSMLATAFDAYLINDSNYFVDFLYLSVEGTAWKLRERGTVTPNSKMHLETFEKSVLNEMQRVSVQVLAYKDDRSFTLKKAVNVELRIDGVKFYKLHTFTENDFFEEPALVYEVVRDDEEVKQLYVDATALQEALLQKETADMPKLNKEKKTADELLEVDLHIHELLDDTTGMSNYEMLSYQLKVFNETLETYKNQKGKKIVFIHGKGDGVLRKALLDELKRKYKTFQSQDASFREYGFGATLVIIG